MYISIPAQCTSTVLVRHVYIVIHVQVYIHVLYTNVATVVYCTKLYIIHMILYSCLTHIACNHLYNFTIASCQYAFCDCLRTRKRASYVALDGVNQPDNDTGGNIQEVCTCMCMYTYMYMYMYS